MPKLILQPIHVKDTWSRPLEQALKKLLVDVIYAPLLEVVEEAHTNAKRTALEQALIEGRVQYRNGMFIGKMTAKLSKEIKALGGRFYQGRWRLPVSLMTAPLKQAIETNKKIRKQLEQAVDQRLEVMGDKAREAINGLSVKSLGAVGMERTSEEFKETVARKMSVQPDKSISVKGKSLISKEYTVTRDKPIKERLATEMDETTKQATRDFAYGEIVKLRDELTLMIASGAPRQDIRDYIDARLDVGETRAKFIARQETSLYTSKLKEAQYKDAGIGEYIWKTVGDSRTRHDHRVLHNKRFSWDNPPVVDDRTKRTGHPGEDFNCRCVAQPIVEW